MKHELTVNINTDLYFAEVAKDTYVAQTKDFCFVIFRRNKDEFQLLGPKSLINTKIISIHKDIFFLKMQAEAAYTQYIIDNLFREEIL